MQNPLSKLQMALPPEALRDLKVRLLLLGIFGISVGLAWWSVSRLPAWEKKLDQQTTRITSLESNIDELKLRWNPEEADQITNRFKQSQEQLFASQAEVLMWQVDLKRRAEQFAMTVNSGITKTQDCPLPGKRFSIYSAAVDLRTTTPGIRTNSPYLRLLNLAQDVTSQKRRVDLTELAASGSSNSVSEARLNLQVWSLENVP